MRFQFENEAKHAVLYKFGHGRYFDAWSVLHVTSGFTAGLLTIILGINWWIGISIVMILLYMYEIFEVITGIVEDVKNSLSDVLCGTLGAVAAYKFYPLYLNKIIPIFYATLILSLIILFLGWRSYLRRRLARAKSENNIGQYNERSARKNIVLFFGLAIASLPLPFISTFGYRLAAAWFAFVSLCVYYVNNNK